MDRLDRIKKALVTACECRGSAPMLIVKDETGWPVPTRCLPSLAPGLPEADGNGGTRCRVCGQERPRLVVVVKDAEFWPPGGEGAEEEKGGS